jgi:hypothetical protein
MRVYVGSTYSDLKVYREALLRALSGLAGISVASMEYFAPGDIPPLHRCVEEVRNSDVYLLIVGSRYGFIPEGHSESITVIEYNEAQKFGKTILSFFLSDEALVPTSSFETDPERRAQLEALRRRVWEGRTVTRFSSPEDLSTRATLALYNLISKSIAPTAVHGRPGELAACKREVDLLKQLVDELSLKLKNNVPAQPIWRGRKFQTDEILCFALLPFQDMFFEVYESAVGPAAASLGLRSLHAGEIFGNREVVEDIWDSICSARLVVVDVTGRNPNVFYELGICHTLGKECIVITQNKDDVPFDIHHRRFIEYSPEKLFKLKAALQKTMQSILSSGSTPFGQNTRAITPDDGLDRSL